MLIFQTSCFQLKKNSLDSFCLCHFRSAFIKIIWSYFTQAFICFPIGELFILSILSHCQNSSSEFYKYRTNHSDKRKSHQNNVNLSHIDLTSSIQQFLVTYQDYLRIYFIGILQMLICDHQCNHTILLFHLSRMLYLSTAISK